MSIEVTPESLRAHAALLRSRGVVEFEVAIWDRWADRLEREQRPLPTVPGWYPGVVVERGGESCTGALLMDCASEWATPVQVEGLYHHRADDKGATIRWADQDGTTPGQTAQAAWHEWKVSRGDLFAFMAAAVLAAHGTPTLTPVGESPEPGTRGLLPVVLNVDSWEYNKGSFAGMAKSRVGRTILADPRPDGAA